MSFFCFSFDCHGRFSFLCNSLGAHHIFVGQAWAEGKGDLATSRQRADSEQETDCTYSRHDLIGRTRVMNKQKKKNSVVGTYLFWRFANGSQRGCTLS